MLAPRVSGQADLSAGRAGRSEATRERDNRFIDRQIAIRAALIQIGAVFALSLCLALALPKSFFEDWGWLSGPTAWMLCAALTAFALGLPRLPTLIGAALAGLPSIVAVVAGLHWLGALVAALLFAAWCGALAGGILRTPLEG